MMRSMTDWPDRELAQALATPLRRRILDLVAAAERPVTVAELTAELGCNHNAVRQHLARLLEAGLVQEHTEARTTPGRPRLLYTAVARPEPYARLAAMLAKAVRTRMTPRALGRSEGRAAVTGSAQTDPIDVLQDEARRQGFAPRRVEGDDSVDVVLDACPFADVAADDPRTICALHRGLAEGIVQGIGGARVVGFVAHDPYDAGCVVHLRRTKGNTR